MPSFRDLYKSYIASVNNNRADNMCAWYFAVRENENQAEQERERRFTTNMVRRLETFFS